MMTHEADLARIGGLLRKVPQPPEQSLPAGASDGALSEFEKRVGFTLPPQMGDLLRLTNGPCVGPGGVFGVRPALDYLDIEALYESYPAWIERRWVPVAGDGCGNYYVAIPHDGGWPVVFIDTMEDAEAPAFVVASGVLRFVVALLEKELGGEGWPFNEQKVRSSDPDIARFAGALTLPWMA
jgi:cell wall assembly regulator SMI1